MSAEAEATALMGSLVYQAGKTKSDWRAHRPIDVTLPNVAEARRLLNRIENAVRRST